MPPKLVRLFDYEPDLLHHVDARHAGVAAARVLIEIEAICEPTPSLATPPDLGHLVLDGLLARRVEHQGCAALELVGAGDVLGRLELGGQIGWTAWCDVLLGRIDQRLANDLAPWPGVMRALSERRDARSDALLGRVAMAQMRSLDGRLLAVLRDLADRWGVVGPDGVRIDLPLTQSALAELTGARRPSVNVALKRLRGRGEVVVTAGRFMLPGAPAVAS